MKNLKEANYLFEIGKAYSLSGNFLESSRVLEKASTLYFNQSKYEDYVDNLHILFKIYKELQRGDKIQQIKEELTALSWEQNKNLAPFIHYIVGQFYLYEKQLDKAQEEFNHSLSKAESSLSQSSDSTEKISHQLESMYALFGLATVDTEQNKTLESMEKIQQIREHLKSYEDNNKLKDGRFSEDSSMVRDFLRKNSISREQLSADVEFLYLDNLFFKHSYIEAEEHLWNCYENVQNSKNLYIIVQFFYYLGKTYIHLQNHKQAHTFLNLAKKSVDERNFKQMSQLIELQLQQLKNIQSSDYDLIVNLGNHSIVERNKGKISFKSQYILMDLFKIFLNHPGAVYSKEKIAEELWREKYDPHVHNNKIYVTIKRLRELMEPNCQSPTYIFRNKEGYYFNKDVKVLLEDKERSADLLY